MQQSPAIIPSAPTAGPTGSRSQGSPSTAQPQALPGRQLLALHVTGDRILDSNERIIGLYGFDDSAASACIAAGGSVFVNGLAPEQQPAFVTGWHGDAVRISLNEDCWLGINGAPAAFDAATYQQGIKTAVAALNAIGDYVILDLHWNAPGSRLAKGQQLMADADHSPAFWASVAATFAANGAVFFELYNEPHDISWSCWLSGCTAPGGWQIAGMQSLVSAVRSAGAHQIVLLGGLGYSNDLSGWLQNPVSDPSKQDGAALHMHNVDGCVDPTCWDQSIAPASQAVPVLATEIGERDSGSAFVTQFAGWADAHGIAYLGWQASRPYAATLRTVYQERLSAP